MLNVISLWAALTVAQAPADPACEAVQPRYVEGFEALVRGEEARALEALDAVVRACPTHPFAAELARLARTRLAEAPAPAPAAPEAELAAPQDLRSELPTRLARAELVSIQTLHGATQGLLLCASADCSDGRAIAGSALAGAAVGLGVSLLVFPEGVRPGQALAINSGSAWGAIYGVMFNELVDDSSGDGDVPRVMLSMAAFTGAGALAAQAWQPAAGQVSMVNSGGLWAGVLTGLLLSTGEDVDDRTFFGMELTALSAGMVGMGIAAAGHPVSRGRMLVIDAGGILGGLAGAAAVYFADQDPGDGLALGTAVGVGAGLAATTLLTRNFDAPELPEGVALLPQLGRDVRGLSLVGRF